MAVAVSTKEKKTDVVNNAVRELQQGRNNATGTVTLTASATTTTVQSPNCSKTSFVLLSPQTSDAAADMASTWCIPGTASFVIHHASNPGVDRTFGWLVTGGT